MIGYNYHDDSYCFGGSLGIHEETLEAAISGCNMDSRCRCIDRVVWDRKYYLSQGTETRDSNYGHEAWVS